MAAKAKTPEEAKPEEPAFDATANLEGHGGRFVVSGGKKRRVDPTTDEHHEYPAAKPATKTEEQA
jgi:hypothetical protein